MAKATPEGKVKAKCKQILKAWDVWYYMPVQNGMGVVGIPDIIACFRGLFMGIECKAPGKRNNTTPNQKAQLRAIKQAKGVAVVIDDAQQLEDILEIIAHARKIKKPAQ